MRHKSGQFFGVEGVRVESGDLREVASWDQPIYTQLEGGILAMVARETADKGVQFLLQARPEPGNIGILQFCPTIQSTWSNIRRAHAGKRPPMVEVLTAEAGVRIVYRAEHNEEGGRFWRKSNENIVAFLDDEARDRDRHDDVLLGQPQPDQGTRLDGQCAQSVRQDDPVAAVADEPAPHPSCDQTVRLS